MLKNPEPAFEVKPMPADDLNEKNVLRKVNFKARFDIEYVQDLNTQKVKDH